MCVGAMLTNNADQIASDAPEKSKFVWAFFFAARAMFTNNVDLVISSAPKKLASKVEKA